MEQGLSSPTSTHIVNKKIFIKKPLSGAFFMAFRVLSYLRYFFFSRGLQWLHSPFVFAFASKILKNQESKTGKKIEAFRLFLGDFQRSIKRKDLGAGSTKGIQTWSKIADLARVASRRRKAGELLYRIVKQYQPKTILEFGTHLGISGLYLQSGNPSAEFITMEGDPALAALAKKHFKAFGYKPEIITGDFSESLRLLLIDPTFWPDLVFVDGNHRKKPTLNYFNLLLQKTS